MARRRRGLSADDRALWAQVAATAKPLRAPKTPPATEPSTAKTRPAPPREPDPAPPPAHILRPTGRGEPSLRWTTPRNDRPEPVARTVPGLDGATARKLRRGRREPDARLDLHGMTADRAHRALTRFVLDSRAQGLRCVLVVTGKGRGESGGRGEGVLRRDAPRWLTVPPLADAVVHVAEAHQRHGGGGALYVYLKRRR